MTGRAAGLCAELCGPAGEAASGEVIGSSRCGVALRSAMGASRVLQRAVREQRCRSAVMQRLVAVVAAAPGSAE